MRKTPADYLHVHHQSEATENQESDVKKDPLHIITIPSPPVLQVSSLCNKPSEKDWLNQLWNAAQAEFRGDQSLELENAQ